jgi:hypothetical protein
VKIVSPVPSLGPWRARAAGRFPSGRTTHGLPACWLCLLQLCGGAERGGVEALGGGSARRVPAHSGCVSWRWRQSWVRSGYLERTAWPWRVVRFLARTRELAMEVLGEKGVDMPPPGFTSVHRGSLFKGAQAGAQQAPPLHIPLRLPLPLPRGACVMAATLISSQLPAPVLQLPAPPD